jgi:hypothetical protein
MRKRGLFCSFKKKRENPFKSRLCNRDRIWYDLEKRKVNVLVDHCECRRGLESDGSGSNNLEKRLPDPITIMGFCGTLENNQYLKAGKSGKKQTNTIPPLLVIGRRSTRLFCDLKKKYQNGVGFTPSTGPHAQLLKEWTSRSQVSLFERRTNSAHPVHCT